MHSSVIFSLISMAAAATIDVKVGSGGLKFEPDSVKASMGDMINFSIGPTHNVAQSTFDAPCKPSGPMAIWSGDDMTSFSIMVNSTDPMWFYCATGSHCSSGMVFAVNPTGDKTIDAFKSKAAGAGSGEEPSMVNNGGAMSTGGAMASGTSGATMSSSSSAADAVLLPANEALLVGLSGVLAAIGLL